MPATHDITEIQHVFSIWASLADMARELDRPYQTVAKWSQRKRIPPESFAEVVAGARRRRVFLSEVVLNRVNAPRKTTRQRIDG